MAADLPLVVVSFPSSVYDYKRHQHLFPSQMAIRSPWIVYDYRRHQNYHQSSMIDGNNSSLAAIGSLWFVHQHRHQSSLGLGLLDANSPLVIVGSGSAPHPPKHLPEKYQGTCPKK